jgi:hypothetical protein
MIWGYTSTKSLRTPALNNQAEAKNIFDAIHLRTGYIMVHGHNFSDHF